MSTRILQRFVTFIRPLEIVYREPTNISRHYRNDKHHKDSSSNIMDAFDAEANMNDKHHAQLSKQHVNSATRKVTF